MIKCLTGFGHVGIKKQNKVNTHLGVLDVAQWVKDPGSILFVSISGLTWGPSWCACAHLSAKMDSV